MLVIYVGVHVSLTEVGVEILEGSKPSAIVFINPSGLLLIRIGPEITVVSPWAMIGLYAPWVAQLNESSAI